MNGYRQHNETTTWGMWKCGYRRFFNFFHNQVGQNWTDRGTHGTSKDLFVVIAIILEIVVVEDKICKFHDVINGQVGTIC